MPALNLELVGPFHVLQGQLTGVPWQQCVLQDRYFYDLPEVVTVLRSDDDRGFHLGYFRLVGKEEILFARFAMRESKFYSC